MSITQTLTQWYDTHYNQNVPYWMTQSFLYNFLDSLPESLFEQRVAGRSTEDRPIRLIKTGSGPVSVLIWSQMHGDEPTATRALIDIFSIIKHERTCEIINSILGKCTLYLLPMINPDGAERFSRRTALGIDMNRDALALRTPEAGILRAIHNESKAEWAYSLHDQEPRYTVGGTGKAAGISILAAASDWDQSINEVRRDTMRLASCLAKYVNQVLPEQISRYDEAYEPRAFGDVFHSMGTRCLLVESGYLPGDRYKEQIRKANVISILASLFHLSQNDLPSTDLYNSLPVNRRYFAEYIFKNASVSINGDDAGRADVAAHIIPEPDKKRKEVVYRLGLSEVGDCFPYVASYTIDSSSLIIRFHTGESEKCGLPETDEYLDCEIISPGSAEKFTVSSGQADQPIEEKFQNLLI